MNKDFFKNHDNKKMRNILFEMIFFYDDDNDTSFKYNTFHYGPNLGVYECHADATSELELLGKCVGNLNINV